MIISELIKVLEQRKERWGDINVMAQWEGVFHDIEPDSVWKMKEGDYEIWERQAPTLIVDADFNYYKKAYAEDLKEGEKL